MSPIGMCYPIQRSVGLGGWNDPADVKVVQKLLIQNGVLPDQAMSYDLAWLVKAIKRFQAGFMLNPDGKVDPKGTTFERLQGLGLVEMPADGGLGWYRYESGDLNTSRIMHFGTANTVRAVLEVAGSAALGLPGCAVGVGDLSSAMGTNLGRHHSHLHGLNVDVRPLRVDFLPLPTNIHEPLYSREYTLLLVDAFLAHWNVHRILFDDAQILQERPLGVQFWPGHENHLHVIMSS